MKNFEKFRSQALNGDALKEIKGGMGGADFPCHEVSHACAVAYDICKGECYDHGPFMDCVYQLNPTCSPLTGYDNVCINDCPIPPES